VVDKGAVSHGQGGAAEVIDAAADAAAEEGAAPAPECLVPAEEGGNDGGTALVQQAAAEDIDGVGGGRRGVAGQDIPLEGQAGPGLIEDTAPAEAADGRPVGDAQAGQDHGRPVADVEDPAGRIAA